MLTISKYHHNCLTVTESTKVYSISAAAITRAGTGRADVGCRHQRVGVQCWGRRWGGGGRRWQPVRIQKGLKTKFSLISVCGQKWECVRNRKQNNGFGLEWRCWGRWGGL